MRFAHVACINECCHVTVHDQVRRGAAHVVGMLVKGLERDTFDVLGSHNSKELVRMMRHVEDVDTDPVTRYEFTLQPVI